MRGYSAFLEADCIRTSPTLPPPAHKEHGQREPITLHEGKILDGWHRYKACKDLNMKPETRECPLIDGGGSALDFVTSMNIARRHLTIGQRAMISARLAGIMFEHGGDRRSKDFQPPVGGLKISGVEAAKKMKISPTTHDRARLILKRGTPGLIKAVENGRMTVVDAEIAAKKDGLVPKVTFHKSPHVSDERKIASCVDSLSTISGILVELSGCKLESDWIKSLFVSRRNMTRFLRRGTQ